MRLLAFFLGTVAAVLALVAGLNRWIDPTGQFYDREILAAAVAEPERCWMSADLFGNASWFRLKEDLFRRRKPRTIVVGTSRALAMHSWPGERDFANLAVPLTGVETIGPLFRRLHETHRGPLTVYLAVELFWFNRTWGPEVAHFNQDMAAKLEYLLARQNFRASVSLLSRSPETLVRRWRKSSLAKGCVIERDSEVVEGNAEAWTEDGSLRTRWDLVPDVARPPSDDFVVDLITFERSHYRDWHAYERERLKGLDRVLAQARRYGWRVVGVALPYSTRYVRRLATAPQTAQRWREFGTLVPPIFERHGFPFVDLRRVRDVPCGEADFDYGNDGWHADRACSMRVRRYLDSAARGASSKLLARLRARQRFHSG